MKFIISILLLAVGLSSNAQHGKKDKDFPLITRSLGASFQKFDGLNSRVAKLPQYKQLKNNAATIGLGWLKERNRFISVGGINLGSSMSGDHNKKSSTIHYIGFDANIGYDLLKSDHVMLYPLAGLGLQGYQAIFYKDNSAVSFDDVLQSATLQNSISSTKFSNAFFLYRFGVGFSVKSPKHPENSIGIQAGYAGSFKKNAWKSNEGQTLANAPEDKISQFFIGLVLTSKPMFMR